MEVKVDKEQVDKEEENKDEVVVSRRCFYLIHRSHNLLMF